ncbi:hypothetical protein V490_03675 [Pseudogymnoascus sp. VKM F-3557]|nr:hypothetical protein V490_03675 [Pseudogymnoascus sp. VKM F-3557]
MDPLSITAGIIAIVEFTATLVKYASDIKDAPKDRARFAMEASSLSSLLLNLRYQIEDEECKKSSKAWYKEVALLGVPGGPLDQYRIALETLQLKIVTGKGVVKISNALWWKFSKEEVASILLRIERLKSLIQIALQMDHLELSKAINDRLDEIHEDGEGLKLDMGVVKSHLPVIQDSVDAVQREQERQKNQVLVEWISSEKYSYQQSDIISKRQPGTGQWFLDSPEFNSWLGGPSLTLFCPGIPGAGKTMISAIAVDRLHRLPDMGRGTLYGVAQIFFDYKTQSGQNITSLLSAILKQLVQAKPSAAKAATILYQRHSSQGTRPSLDEIFAALKTSMMSFCTVYIIVDALDECSDRDGTRSQFLAKLRDLQDEFDLHLMVTSRANPDIVSQFTSSTTLEIRASPADVKQFVRGQIYRLPKCVQRDNKLQGEIEDKIVEAVDGMFLLARLHVDSLLDKRTKAAIQSMLKMLPRGSEALKSAYDDAIKRIETQLTDDSKLAKSVLSWITYAEQPLTTEELCHALAVNPDDTDFDEDNVLDVDDIVSVCAGLVTVDEESNIIRLVHYTTQEYLVLIRESWSPTAQQEITTTCLTYLSLNPFKSGFCETPADFDARIAHYKFLEYASKHWGHHAQTVQEHLFEQAFTFLRNEKLVSFSVQIILAPKFRFLRHLQTPSLYGTGVHLTAMFGLQYLLAGLLSGSDGASTMSAQSRDGFGQTSLSWAAKYGQMETVKLLAGRDDVKADSKDNYGQTPLAWAAKQGQTAVVKFLVERNDVEVDSEDFLGYTPLVHAAVRGNEEAAKFLMELDAVDADFKDSSGRTPLSFAAEAGHSAIVGLLLERQDVGADIQDDAGRTPFSYAAQSGSESTTKMFLERKDIDFNTVDTQGNTALLWAAQLGNEAVVKLLLGNEDIKAGADSVDIHNRTALSLAAPGQDEAVVKLLLENKGIVAKVDMKDRFGITPLMLAADWGNEPVLRLLLGRQDVDANLRDNQGLTPLLRAAEKGYGGIVKLLLGRRDVDPNSKGEMGQTPLLWAAQRGEESIVKLLLEREDIDPTVKNDLGQTALSLAEELGHNGIVDPKPNESSWHSPADRRGITVASLTVLSSDQLSLQQHLDLSSSILSYLPDSAEGEPQPLIMAQAVPNPPSGRKRVKVYELRNNDWFDRGTGFAIASSTWDHADGEPRIIVEAEEGPERLLLETKISRQGGFAKQQETLIIWTEPVDGVDMALSFQESDGCTAIWKFINIVQQQMVVSGPDDALSEDMAPEAAPVNLPVPDINNLKEVELEMRQLNNTQAGRDALAKFVINEEYIPKLVPLIEEAEAAHRLGELHRLCNIVKMLILLNDNDIIEYAMTDEVFLGVMGALEYDPDFPSHKANHRQWLGDESRYKEVVRIDDDQVRRKIHHTYRLQYLKDVALARVLDDPTFSILNSLIFYYQVDIIQHIQGNPAFLNDLFAIFGPEEKDEKRKKDAVLFIQQCCAIAKNFQPPARNSLYNNFLNHGLLAVINYALAHNDVAVRVGATDVLVSVIDHDPQMIRQTIFRQISEKQRPLTDSLIDLLLVEVDLGVKAQIADAIKVLLDPGSQQGPQEGMGKLGIEFGGRGRPQVDPQQEGFLVKFYEESAKKLFSPLVELKDKENLVFNVQQVSLFEHLIEILWFFIRQHQHRSKYFVLAESLGQRIAQLLSCSEKHLKLTALKFFRNLLGLNDEFYNQQMIQEHLLEPILNTLLDTMPRNNLLNSACLDFFEYIRNHGVPIMVSHLVERYRDKIQDITYVDTFTALISRFDHASQGGYASNMDASFLETEDEGPGGRSQPGGGRRWQGVRDLDAAEEQYFNTSDDEDDIAFPKSPPGASVNGASPLAKPLVDYASDEETDMTDAELAGILPSREAGSPPAPEKEAEHKSPSPPPPERVSEKRRREEDEEDEITKLASQQSKRRNSSSSVVSVGSNGSTPMLRRKKSFNSPRDGGGGGGGGGGGKKISISLAPAIKSGGDGGAGADDGS